MYSRPPPTTAHHYHHQYLHPPHWPIIELVGCQALWNSQCKDLSRFFSQPPLICIIWRWNLESRFLRNFAVFAMFSWNCKASVVSLGSAFYVVFIQIVWSSSGFLVVRFIFFCSLVWRYKWCFSLPTCVRFFKLLSSLNRQLPSVKHATHTQTHTHIHRYTLHHIAFSLSCIVASQFGVALTARFLLVEHCRSPLILTSRLSRTGAQLTTPASLYVGEIDSFPLAKHKRFFISLELKHTRFTLPTHRFSLLR